MMKDESEEKGHPDAGCNANLDPPVSAKPEVGEEVNNSSRQSSARTGKKKTLEALCSIRCHYNSMAHLKCVEEFYSPRRNEDLATAEKVLQITFSACTPRLLVGPPLPTQLQVPSPDSEGEGGEKDITSAGPENVSDTNDINLESSSETGWSVRDNPIASNNSCKPDADSDEEDFVRKVCSDTTTPKRSTTSSVEHTMNLDSEADIEDYYTGRERGPDRRDLLASDMTSPSKFLYLNEERVIKPYGPGDVESTKRRKVLSRSSSSNPPQEALSSLIVEDNCSCSGKEHDVKQYAEVGQASLRGAHEVEVLSPPAYLLSVQVSGRIVDVIRKTWRSVLSYSDLFLGGSLVIALAFPIVAMISKLVISSSQEHFRFYVPT